MEELKTGKITFKLQALQIKKTSFQINLTELHL